MLLSLICSDSIVKVKKNIHNILTYEHCAFLHILTSWGESLNNNQSIETRKRNQFRIPFSFLHIFALDFLLIGLEIVNLSLN